MPLCLMSQRRDERSRACKQTKGVQRWDFYVKLNLQLHPGWDVDDCMIDVFAPFVFIPMLLF